MTDKNNYNDDSRIFKIDTTTYSDILKTKPLRMRGLGDLIEKITSSLHIPKCKNCEKRQKFLNSAFSFGFTAGSE